MSNLVSTEWLAAHLGEVRLVDASWYMPGDKRAPAKEFEAGHIPGAIFFDIDAISDHATDLPHMLPAPGAFAAAMGALGIGNDETVIVYDGSGIFSAPRVWWMLKAMGHGDVKVLDGGLPKWTREGRVLQSGAAKPAAKSFTADAQPGLIRDFGAVMGIVDDKSARMVDARSAGRYTGAEAEPRAGVRGGHMPGAVNVHFRALLTPDGTFKPPADLRAEFEKAGVDISKPIVTTCGTGVTAAILMLALEEIGASDVALYDGSWTEWGSRPEAPVVTGA
ncbi:MAG: 3-mercaptopyruvate sulfurtransferase [Alphaproteobacteria bacterium]|nr:3-mercaptopyruvate sulfurtransferase [Alphaproteobacteria bacterium]